VVHDHDNIQKEIRFPYANLSLTSVPPARRAPGPHPCSARRRSRSTSSAPATCRLTVDLRPIRCSASTCTWAIWQLIKQVKLTQDKEFIARGGMPMVWIRTAFLGRQVRGCARAISKPRTGYNPSIFHKPGRPVEPSRGRARRRLSTSSNKFESKAGKLPAGCVYALPKESQWDMLNADANLDDAATSRVTTLNSRRMPLFRAE